MLELWRTAPPPVGIRPVGHDAPSAVTEGPATVRTGPAETTYPFTLPHTTEAASLASSPVALFSVIRHDRVPAGELLLSVTNRPPEPDNAPPPSGLVPTGHVAEALVCVAAGLVLARVVTIT